jgi:hypothetical protein
MVSEPWQDGDAPAQLSESVFPWLLSCHCDFFHFFMIPRWPICKTAASPCCPTSICVALFWQQRLSKRTNVMLMIHEIGHASKQERVIHVRVFMIDDDFDVSGLCWLNFVDFFDFT